MTLPLRFVQFAADPLNGPNLNPINPAVWTNFIGTFPNSQILNNVCITTGTGGNLFSGCWYSGTTFPGDQYIQVTAHFNNNNADMILFLRMDNAQHNYYLVAINPNGNAFGNSLVINAVHIGQIPSSITLLANSKHTFTNGDVYLFAAAQNTLYFYQNGTLLESVNADNTRNGGIMGFELDDVSAITDVGITLFSGGGVATPDTIFTSIPYTDPQNNILANGSLTFDLSHAAVPSGAGGGIVPMRVAVPLTSGGLIPANTLLWGNGQLTPSNTTYRLRVYNSNGLLVGDWGQVTITGTSPIDISQLNPV